MQCDCPAKRLLIASIAYIRGRYAHQVATNMECCYQGYNSRRKQHQHFVKTPSTALLHYTAGTARQAQTSLTNRSKTPEKRKQEGCCFPHRKGGGGGVSGPNFDNGHIAYCTQTPHIFSHETASKAKARTKEHTKISQKVF